MLTEDGTAFVLLLSGPSGAGKSTAADAWAEKQPVPTAAISHDYVRQQIRAGFASPVKVETSESAQQWDLAIDLCSGMAGQYLEAGVRCVVEAYRPPQERDRWDEKLAGLDVRSVILLPRYEVARARNVSMSRELPLDDEDHERNYSNLEWSVKEFRPAFLIDNSDMTIAETVEAIDRCLAKGRASGMSS